LLAAEPDYRRLKFLAFTAKQQFSSRIRFPQRVRAELFSLAISNSSSPAYHQASNPWLIKDYSSMLRRTMNTFGLS
jgi:hypothetical protein